MFLDPTGYSFFFCPVRVAINNGKTVFTFDTINNQTGCCYDPRKSNKCFILFKID